MGLSPNTATMCNVFVKIILFCITILTLLIGAGLVALPTLKGYKLDINFDDITEDKLKDVPTKLLNVFQYNVIYISYLSFGIATIVTGFIGMLAISRKNCFARWLYCMITLVMAVVAGCSIYIANMYHADFFTTNPKNQNSMNCCGLINPKNITDTCFGWSDNIKLPKE